MPYYCTRHSKWTEEEVKFLIENYYNSSYQDLMSELKRTRWSINQKARILKLKKYSWWNRNEIEFLRSHYTSSSKQFILSNLKRTWESIMVKARKLGIKREDKTLFDPNKVQLLPLNDFDLGFIVAFIEGEGCIFINTVRRKKYPNKIYHYPCISICNTDKELIEKVTKILGKKADMVLRSTNNKKHKGIYQFSINKILDIYQILKTIEPHLISKKEQAKLVMEFIENRNKNRKRWSIGENGMYVPVDYTKKQKEIVKQVKQLNKRGSSSGEDKPKIEEAGS